MKYILSFILLMLTSFAWAAEPAAESSLNEGLVNPGYEEKPDWFKESFLDIREDVSEATEADKRVILYFYQDGCPYCAKLLRDNFGDQAIADKTQQNFDVIAINMWGDRSVTDFGGGETTEKDFAADLKVQYTPTMLFLNEEGTVVLRLNGYYVPEAFQLALDFSAGKHDREGNFRDYYAKLQAGQQAAAVERTIAESLPSPLKLKDDREGSGRPLLVIFEQADCAACDELHEDVLTRREVGYSLSNLDIAVVDVNSADSLQTPQGKDETIADWVKALDIKYTPGLVFFDDAGKEVFRTEAYLKTFHLHGAMDYVISGAYQWQPEFQRFLQHRTETMRARGFEVELME
ncbi:MAG: thioredoxin fold domain-containing protein [Thiolinea sp.]